MSPPNAQAVGSKPNSANRLGATFNGNTMSLTLHMSYMYVPGKTACGCSPALPPLPFWSLEVFCSPLLFR